MRQIGVALLEGIGRHQRGVLSSGFWSDRLMQWATQDVMFKTQLFRFVDVFPVLDDAQAVRRHLDEYLRAPGVKLPPGLGAGLLAGGLLPDVMARTITGQIEQMGRQFIAGADARAALPLLRKRWESGIAFSLDLLGEACVSDDEAQDYQARYLELIETTAAAVADWPARPTLERDHVGRLPRANISLKVSSLLAQFDPMDHDRAIARMLDQLQPLLTLAASRGVMIHFDMEQHALKDLTLDLFMAACEKWDFPAGIVLQAYLRSGPDDAARLIGWTRRTGRCVTVRLVKGAYWDYEIAQAQKHDWPVPVWTHKAQSDACFERMAGQLIDASPRLAGQGGVKLALGSHNARSVAAAMAMLRQAGLPEEALELQMLRGMADPFKAAAVERGLRVREYIPIGALIPGMAYLVRRLLENTSNQSWLLGQATGQMDADTLLAAPQPPGQDQLPLTDAMIRSPWRHAMSPAVEGLGDGQPFMTEPMRDFSDAAQRRAFAQAVAESRLPSRQADVTIAQADDALRQAVAARRDWGRRPVRERAALLMRTAELMRQRRDELAGLIIREVGKTWRSADADVCEAIDFLTYYARQAVALVEGDRLGRFIAEHNHLMYRPRGVAVVISPWNFPLAICTGMSAAALVMGNPTLVKPAEQSPVIASVMVDLMHQAGIPRDVVQDVPGDGETVGAHLAASPEVAIIAFTGSKAVGLELMRVAAQVAPGQRHAKRLVCEMGGKNAILVDASASPHLAVSVVRESAFGYSGQKCSACSRVITVGMNDARHAAFVDRLIASTRSLTMGDPLDPGTDIGPVIDREAADRIGRYIEIGKQEGTLAYAGQVPEGLAERVGKPYVGPHIFTGIESSHRLAREEIFGPVLALLRADTMQDAIAMANDSEYKLTGAVVSRTPSHLAMARRDLAVGNLYLNQASTGALVGRQPFGGFGLSGVGEKAGGPAYLRQFADATVCTENTLSSGFSPEIFDLPA